MNMFLLVLDFSGKGHTGPLRRFAAKNAFGRPGKFVADNAENAAPASDFGHRQAKTPPSNTR